MNGRWRKLAIILALFSLIQLPAPSVAQGIALYDRDTDEYLQTWDMRQIIIVSKENDTHERITMFVAVCSFSPRNNFTLAMPLKTMPSSLSIKQTDESSFRARYKLDAAEDAARKQTDAASYERMSDEMKRAASWYSGGTILTLPGVYVGILVIEQLQLVSQMPAPGSMSSMTSIGNSSYLHSIRSNSTFGDVVANASLGLTQKALDEAQNYSSYSAILLDAQPHPPILPGDYQVLQDYVPNALADFIDFAERHPRIERNKLDQLFIVYDQMIMNENPQEAARLYQRMRDLINATYGNAKFNGFQIDIVAPLDGGKLHFPLGIARALPYPSRNTAVYVKVGEDNSFEGNIVHSSEAYYGGSHYYMYTFRGKSPTSDLSGKVTDDSGRKTIMQGAQSSYENAQIYAVFLLIGIVAAVWFPILMVILRRNNKKLDKKDVLQTLPYSLAFLALLPLGSAWVVAFGFFVLMTGSNRITEQNRKSLEVTCMIFTAIMTCVFVISLL